MTRTASLRTVIVAMVEELESLRPRIREVLLRDWDPHDAARSPAAAGSYDAYVPPLYDLLKGGADEEAVVEFLRDRERESMCFPSLDTRRLRPVAQKLLALVTR